MPWHDALLISDYGKGVCTPRLLRAAIDAANLVGIPVIVDPSRSCPLEHYQHVTLIKPNRVETELATGMLDRTSRTKHWPRAGKLCEQIGSPRWCWSRSIATA